jgi:hypothetical protein
MRAADVWSIFIVGFILIVAIVFLESYYRTSIPEGSLWTRFSLVMVFEFGLLFITNLTKNFLTWLVTPFSWRSLTLPVLEILVTSFFVWLWSFFKRKNR